MSQPGVVERLERLKPQSRLFCTRFFRRKKDAERAATWFKKHGATWLKMTEVDFYGKWRVRCRIEVSQFAKFCALEAKRESKSN